VVREIRATGEVLAQEAVRVLVRAALPWALRVAKVHLDVRGDGEVPVVGHLHAAVPGQRSAQFFRQPAHLSLQRLHHRRRFLVLEPDQHGEARAPLHERCKVRVARPRQQVALPVAGYCAVLRVGGTIADRHRADDLAARLALGRRARRAAHDAARAQVVKQLPFEHAPRLNEQTAVYRLVRHAHARVVGEFPLQPSGDLLRRPVEAEFTRHNSLQPSVEGQPAGLLAPRPLPRGLVGVCGAVPAAAAMARELAAHRRRRAPEPRRRDLADRFVPRDSARDLLALGERQRTRGPRARGWRDPAMEPEHAVHRARVLPERKLNLGERLACFPSRPQLGLLRCGESRSSYLCHAIHLSGSQWSRLVLH